MTDTVLIAIIGAAGLALGGLFTLLGTNGKTSADAKTALDTRIDARVQAQLQGAWGEIDDLKKKVDELESADRRKSAAFARILRSLAYQWPDAHVPDLDPADLAELEDTLPNEWVRRGWTPRPNG